MLTKKEIEKNPNIPTKCPKCGSKSLLNQDLPEGDIQTICLDPDCDFGTVTSSFRLPPERSGEDFSLRISRLPDDQLAEMEEKLRYSCQTLTGRSLATAKQQLAEVRAELQVRPPRPGEEKTAPEPEAEPTPHRVQKMPPQFKTSRATQNRIKGIREYYRRKKFEPKVPELVAPNGPTRWFDTLIKTLRDEASRHEQAAHHYSRVPDLSTLHIEHSARAFELNRVIDLFSNYLKAIVRSRAGV